MSPVLASRAGADGSPAPGDPVPVAVDPQARIDSLLTHLGTRAGGLSSREVLVLACFPFIVWGSDELWRWRRRKQAQR